MYWWWRSIFLECFFFSRTIELNFIENKPVCLYVYKDLLYLVRFFTFMYVNSFFFFFFVVFCCLFFFFFWGGLLALLFLGWVGGIHWRSICTSIQWPLCRMLCRACSGRAGSKGGLKGCSNLLLIEKTKCPNMRT